MAGRKLKNHSGASKRISRTGTGKLRHRKGGRRHLLTGKARARKRRLSGTDAIPKTATLTIRRQLPYNS
jgi:large subunit ribosomal protein L35